MSRIFYEIEIRHDRLNKYRHIRGSDRYIVQQKAEMQLRAWEEQWQRQQERENSAYEKEMKRQERESLIYDKEKRKQHAVRRTKEANAFLESLVKTLHHTLSINDTINWESLKNKSPFAKTPPRTRAVSSPKLYSIPPAPGIADPKYQPKLGILGKLFPFIARSKRAAMAKIFEEDVTVWERMKLDLENHNSNLQKGYEEELAKVEQEYRSAFNQYEVEKASYEADKLAKNNLIDQKKAEYMALDQGAIIDYCEMVLSNSQYPDFVPKQFDIDYLPDSKMLLVDYTLPAPTHIPSLKEIKYIQTRDEFKEISLSDKELYQLYDELVYQISLRTLHELFEADAANALNSICFNGLVTSIDRGIGHDVTKCILSIQANKEAFVKINLANISPKDCFQKLKGVGSSKLHSLAPIPPIATMNKEDRRFVDGYNVAQDLDSSSNLAAMDWEDFEHLVRELFEKEFRQNGAEVRVTQASRDGGVDAVVFDPDPLRGGKIVIQAKRYIHTVSVSAVRELFGTVMNEGAIKGILVTTSDYGPDAYEFAKDKPLTLLNGSNLLHLLSKHGHRAKIDLTEARNLSLARH